MRYFNNKMKYNLYFNELTEKAQEYLNKWAIEKGIKEFEKDDWVGEIEIIEKD